MKPTDYIKGDRRGREAHDLELDAMRDPFLAEALEGLENTDGDHAAATDALGRRIAARASADNAADAPGATAQVTNAATQAAGSTTQGIGTVAQGTDAATQAAETAQVKAIATGAKSMRIRKYLWRIVPAAAAILIAVTAGLLTLRHTPGPTPPGGVPPLADNRQDLPAADSVRHDSLSGQFAAAHNPAADTRPGAGVETGKEAQGGKGSASSRGAGAGGQATPGSRQSAGEPSAKLLADKEAPGGQRPEAGSDVRQPRGQQTEKQPAAEGNHSGHTPLKKDTDTGLPGKKGPGEPQHDKGQPVTSHPPRGQSDEGPGPLDATDIDKVVVIAYGKRNKNTFVGSTGTTVPAGRANLEPDKAPDPAPTIRVRGTGRSKPGDDAYGYLVDGKPYDDIAWLAADRVASINIDHPRKRIVIQTKGTAALAQAMPSAGDDLPFMVAETMPRFQGGSLDDFRRWVQARIRKPQAALANGMQGRVIVSFTIDTLGRLTDIEVLRTPDKSLSDEAVRVLEQSPVWEPGRQGNRKVRVKYTLPVDFGDGNMHPHKPAPKAAGERPTPEKPVKMNGVDISFEEFGEIVNPQLIEIADTTDNIPFTEADVDPRFRGGGIEDFRRWVQAHLREYEWLPTEQPELYGRIVVSFVIDTTGRLGDIRILKSACREFSEEAVRVLEQSPAWEPGYRRTKDGRVKTPAKYTIPVDFR